MNKTVSFDDAGVSIQIGYVIAGERWQAAECCVVKPAPGADARRWQLAAGVVSAALSCDRETGSGALTALVREGGDVGRIAVTVRSGYTLPAAD